MEVGIIETPGGNFMKKPGWKILFVSEQSFSRVRQTTFLKGLLILCILFSMAGLAGMARLVWFSASFGLAKFGVYEARRENEGLLKKTAFLNKFISKESEKIDNLVAFENKVRLQYGMNRISDDVRMAGIGGKPDREEMMISSLLDPVLKQAETVKQRTHSLLRKAELQDSTLSQMSNIVNKTHRQWLQRPSIWPTQGRITSRFGYRFHPIAKHNMFHSGLDIANKTWTPIFAPADGIVKFVGAKDHFGNLIELSHPENNIETLFGHLQQALVNKGQIVKRGELIGYMGSSGRSTGPHLHYEVKIDRKSVDPLGFILPTDVVVD